MAVRVLELRSVRGTGGGPEKTILLGAARSDPADFDVTVCYLRDARDLQFSIGTWAHDLGVKYVEIAERHSFDVGIWKPLRAIVREHRIQIVHSHDYKTDLLAWMLAKRDRIVPVATAHGWTGDSGRERRAYYPLDKRLLTRFPRVIAVSGEIRAELLKHGARANRVDVILNGIDASIFRRDRSLSLSARSALGLTSADVIIGSVGRLEAQKRFDLLIDAFSTLHRSDARLKLVIVGEGSLRNNLMRRAAPLGGACAFLGLRKDVPFLHHAFDLFVQSSDYEGTPNAVLEAMALETPIVATAAGGTAEIIRDGIDGLIVNTGDPSALSAAIARALDDGSATARRTRSARTRVEHELSFDTRTRTMERVYQQLITEPVA